MPIPATQLIVTIDGGAAAGKSSTSRLLAQRFDLLHVDTGSHYRALTHALLLSGVNLGDESAVAAVLPSIAPGWQREGQAARITLGAEPLGPDELRREAVNHAVSQVAAQPAVRAFLRDYQRAFGQAAHDTGCVGLIMEGRDIGSVIFPDAPLRFFLEADEAARIARRAAEGHLDAIAERDRRDASRKTAPLTCPEGAERVDTTHRDLESVVSLIAERIETWLKS